MHRGGGDIADAPEADTAPLLDLRKAGDDRLTGAGRQRRLSLAAQSRIQEKTAVVAGVVEPTITARASVTSVGKPKQRRSSGHFAAAAESLGQGEGDLLGGQLLKQASVSPGGYKAPVLAQVTSRLLATEDRHAARLAAMKWKQQAEHKRRMLHDQARRATRRESFLDSHLQGVKMHEDRLEQEKARQMERMYTKLERRKSTVEGAHGEMRR